MSIYFRPRVGPFVYARSRKPGLFSTLFALCIVLPVTLCWWLIKYTYLGTVWLCLLLADATRRYQATKLRATHVREPGRNTER